MIQMLGQVTNLIMPKFIARKPKIKHGTYNKCGQHVNCSDVPWEEEVQLGYVRKEERCE